MSVIFDPVIGMLKRATTKKEVSKFCVLYQKEGEKIINLSPDMTIDDINLALNNCERDLEKYKILIIQFADGTYNLNGPIRLSGFRGGGHLAIQGNLNDNQGPDTNRSVILNFEGSFNYGFVLEGMSLRYITIDKIRFIKTDQGTHNITNSTLLLDNINARIRIDSCAFQLGSQRNHGFDIYCRNSSLICQYSMFNYGYIALFATEGAHIHSSNNDDSGRPAYGLYTKSGGFISKAGTQPTGNIANEHKDIGVGIIE